VARTLVTHSAAPRVPLFLFLPRFDVICDLLLNRRTATWNLFVKWTTMTFLPNGRTATWNLFVKRTNQLHSEILFLYLPGTRYASKS